MNATNTGETPADILRRRTISLIDSACDQAEEAGIPVPDERLGRYRRTLEENAYRVLVVGEAKRGKSTFVNALMGRDLLSTDVDVATSQVFQIRQTPEWAYRLRFEDDSAQDLAPEDLPRYGSQVVIDSEGVPRLNQIIRWIEVEGPFSFIPPGISLLDTPGLGALYQSHAQITRRYVPLADAVIFVLDSSQPMGQPDVEFLEEILAVTRSVFVIQTKIDLHRREAWEAVRARNEEILRERFGDRLPSTRVWPIASSLLRKAADTGDEAYEIVSRHRELAAGLREFLFSVAGWGRTADALALLDGWLDAGRVTLEKRLASLQELSRQERDELQQAALSRKQAFETQWGEETLKTRELIEALDRICAVGKTAFRQVLLPGGSIENWQRDQIARATTEIQLKAMSEGMGPAILGAASHEWQHVSGQVLRHVFELLRPVQDSVDALAGFNSGGVTVTALAEHPEMRVGIDKWARVKAARNDAMIVAMLPGTLMAFGALPAGVLALSNPVGWAILAGMAVAGLAGWHGGGQAQIDRIKGQLLQRMAGILLQVRSIYFDVSIDSGQFSVTDEFFHRLQQYVPRYIRETVQRHAQEAQAEIDRLGRVSEATAEQRKAEAAVVRRQLTDWTELSRQIKLRGVELASLPATPPAAN